MKNKSIFFLVFLIICAFSNKSYSQTYKEDKTAEAQIKKEPMTAQMLQGLGITINPEVNFNAVRGNSIFLTQIGGFNNTKIFTSTENSDIKLDQEGNYNTTTLSYRARTAVADLKQEGDYNVITDIINNPDLDVSLQLDQQGDYLNFERQGVNNLTKSLKFTQTNASPSLIIRSN